MVERREQPIVRTTKNLHPPAKIEAIRAANWFFQHVWCCLILDNFPPPRPGSRPIDVNEAVREDGICALLR